MRESQSLRRSIEKALAFAQAAIDQPTAYRILEAKSYAEEVLPRLALLDKATFSRVEVTMLGQLRAMMSLLDRRLHPTEPRLTN